MAESSGNEQLDADLLAIATSIRAIAQNYKGDVLSLLALLRTLEVAHREVRDSLFQESLPDNRQRLYNLLKDMEAEGGWPYIPRMKLKALLSKMSADVADAVPEGSVPK
ncbi:MAG: hypothetical protein VKK04_15660 [Synechococcales bacterium]|nr:hypothetical protein [Synechococcales bacterium]